MGIYGLSVGINGAREATELAEEMRLVRSSPALATFPLLQTVLGWQLCWLFAATLVAEVRSLGFSVEGLRFRVECLGWIWWLFATR